MENKKINIAELLKDCPKGMELYSPIFGELKFNEVNTINNRILVVQQNDYIAEFESDGRLINCKNGECLLFPSKGKTTWEGFHRPFMDGDIVVCTNESCTFTAIFKGMRNGSSFYRYGVMYDNEFRCLVNDWSDFNDSCRLATEEEKEKLFKAIKDNGYKWDTETKTLKKLTPNKFDITTLKPFDKVLMRSSNAREWVATFYSHYSNNKFYGCGMCCDQCIPYEKNEHLLGTTDDCGEYFKTWEE